MICRGNSDVVIKKAVSVSNIASIYIIFYQNFICTIFNKVNSEASTLLV